MGKFHDWLLSEGKEEKPKGNALNDINKLQKEFPDLIKWLLDGRFSVDEKKFKSLTKLLKMKKFDKELFAEFIKAFKKLHTCVSTADTNYKKIKTNLEKIVKELS